MIAAAAVAWWRWRLSPEHANHAIRGSGIVEITEVDVAFEVPGTIRERYVEEGALLDKGEPIARLDDREYRLQVERVTAAKAAAEARYRLLLKGPRGEEIAQALAALEAVEREQRGREELSQRLAALEAMLATRSAELEKLSSHFVVRTLRRVRKSEL